MPRGCAIMRRLTMLGLLEFVNRTSPVSTAIVLTGLTVGLSFNTYQVSGVSAKLDAQGAVQTEYGARLSAVEAKIEGMQTSLGDVNDALGALVQAMLNQKGEVCLKGSSISGRDNIICVKPQRIAVDGDESLRAGG